MLCVNGMRIPIEFSYQWGFGIFNIQGSFELSIELDVGF